MTGLVRNPHLAELEQRIELLKSAPLLAKTQHAEAVARTTVRLLEDFERRLARLEARA